MDAADLPRLVAGSLLPHFTVTTLTGRPFAYSSIWQERNLLLLVLPRERAASAYADALEAHVRDFQARNAVLVVTHDAERTLSAPGVLIADRWGEIIHVATASSIADLPPADAFLEWLDYVERRCPECEGESR